MKLTPWLRLSVAGLVVAASMTQYQKLFAGLLVFAGRSPVCTYAQVVDSISLSTLQSDLTAEVRAASTLLKTDGSYQLWATPLGSFWVPAKSTAAVLYDIAEQKRDVYNFHDRGVKRGDTVLDNGANVGVYTRVALDAGAKKVVAIEPAPENVECLRRNFKNEVAAGKVIIFAKGVWDRDDWLHMYIVPDNSAADTFLGSRDGAVKSEIKLPLTTIDKIVSELRLERVDYMKFDIEGAERNALHGAANTIAKYHPKMAVSVYHLPDDTIVLPGIVANAWSGYEHECGRCEIGGGRVTPQVFFFY